MAEKKNNRPFSALQVIRRRCLRAHHAGSSCTACMDVCEKKAVYLADGRICIDRMRCTLCGKCTSACQTEALTFGKDAESALDKILFSGKKHITLTCSQRTEDLSDFRLHCFHQLKKSFIAEAAATGVATLTCLSGPCQSCVCNGSGQSPEQIISVNLNALGAQEKVQCVWQSKEAEVRLEKRRLFENVLAEQGEVSESIEASAEAWKRVPDGRKRLLWSAKKLFSHENEAFEAKKHFSIPRIDSKKCTGCAVCASSCPTGALKIEKQGEQLAYICGPYACVGCGLCRDVCYQKAVSLCRIEDPTRLLEGRSEVLHVCGELKIDVDDCWENKIGKMFDVPVYRT